MSRWVRKVMEGADLTDFPRHLVVGPMVPWYEEPEHPQSPREKWSVIEHYATFKSGRRRFFTSLMWVRESDEDRRVLGIEGRSDGIFLGGYFGFILFRRRLLVRWWFREIYEGGSSDGH